MAPTFAARPRDELEAARIHDRRSIEVAAMLEGGAPDADRQPKG